MLLNVASAMELPTGSYATIGVGATSPLSSSLEGSTPLGAPLSLNLDTTAGLAPEVGLGYDFGGGRVEVTALYNRAKITTATLHSAFAEQQALATDDKAVETFSAMLSGTIDIPVNRKLELYAGAGIGIRQSNTPGFQIKTPRSTIPIKDGQQTMLGYQFKIGLTVKLRPKRDLFVEGFYAGSRHPQQDASGIVGVRGGSRWWF